MAAQHDVADDTPPKHSLSVNWFLRDGDPVGGTVFVKPAEDVDTATRQEPVSALRAP